MHVLCSMRLVYIIFIAGTLDVRYCMVLMAVSLAEAGRFSNAIYGIFPKKDPKFAAILYFIQGLMLKLFRFLWILSALAYFAVLLLGYAYLPERVGIHADAEGIADQFVEKETFFYVGLGFFIVSNLLGSILLSVLTGIPESAGFYFRSESFKENVTSWFCSFIAVINAFLICAVTYISLFNNQGNYRISQFNWLIYVAPLLLLVNMVWLVVIIVKRAQPAEATS